MIPLLLMGPTGSGKSALALALAERLGGVVVNADASQVYRDLRLLSARPGPAEESRAPHRLYGHVDAADRYSAGRWAAAALAEIEAAEGRGQTAILVGGTGLYFKALTQGLADIPAIPGDVRAALADAMKAEGPAALHARLSPDDAARIRPTDPARILRALEVQAVTGGSLRAAQAAAPAPPLKRWAGLALTPDRARLYETLDARFDAMMAAGALEEARALGARGLDPDLPAMKALGAPALLAHLRGEVGLSDAVERAKRDTRRYAKRQFTWITGQLEGWVKIEAETLAERIQAANAVFVGVDGRVATN